MIESLELVVVKYNRVYWATIWFVVFNIVMGNRVCILVLMICFAVYMCEIDVCVFLDCYTALSFQMLSSTGTIKSADAVPKYITRFQ